MVVDSQTSVLDGGAFCCTNVPGGDVLLGEFRKGNVL